MPIFSESTRESLYALSEASDVGNTILQQLGGARRLQAMIGAKYFMAHTKDFQGLSFQFPNKAAKKPNSVRIKLDPDDTYTVEFLRIRGSQAPKLVSSSSGVHAEDLKRLFEKETGLYLSI